MIIKLNWYQTQTHTHTHTQNKTKQNKKKTTTTTYARAAGKDADTLPVSILRPHNERILSDSSQWFFRCYYSYYFASAVFVVQCISVGYQEQDVVAW